MTWLDWFGTEADLDKRNRVGELMDHVLGWTGLGRWDGADIGSGTMNALCPVVDPELATRVIVRELERRGFLEGLTIAVVTDEEISVRWPPGCQGEFSNRNAPPLPNQDHEPRRRSPNEPMPRSSETRLPAPEPAPTREGGFCRYRASF